jgi:hypothetical protein
MRDVSTLRPSGRSTKRHPGDFNNGASKHGEDHSSTRAVAGRDRRIGAVSEPHILRTKWRCDWSLDDEQQRSNHLLRSKRWRDWPRCSKQQRHDHILRAERWRDWPRHHVAKISSPIGVPSVFSSTNATAPMRSAKTMALSPMPYANPSVLTTVLIGIGQSGDVNVFVDPLASSRTRAEWHTCRAGRDKRCSDAGFCRR